MRGCLEFIGPGWIDGIGVGSWEAVAALVGVAGIGVDIGRRKSAAAVGAADVSEGSVGRIHSV